MSALHIFRPGNTIKKYSVCTRFASKSVLLSVNLLNCQIRRVQAGVGILPVVGGDAGRVGVIVPAWLPAGRGEEGFPGCYNKCSRADRRTAA